MTKTPGPQRRWDTRRTAKAERVHAGAAHSDGKVIKPRRLKDLLPAVIRPGDRVALEGDNQKQADFLSRTLADCDPKPGHVLTRLWAATTPEVTALSLADDGLRAVADRAHRFIGKTSG